MSTVDIFIKSYLRDFKWLYYALDSITRNVTGYNNVILLIPENEKEYFDTRNLPPRTLVHYVKEYGKGWLLQQWYKINSHAYSNADYILFSDSDCFFYKPVDINKYIADGKPQILYTKYEKLPDAIIWKQPTEELTGGTVDFEFMRRFPLVYHRSTLVNISKWRNDLEKVIMDSIKFSEFNLIGAWAYKNENNKYQFLDTDNWSYIDPDVIQIWSHCTKEKGTDELHLREYIRSLEAIMQSYSVPIPQ